MKTASLLMALILSVFLMQGCAAVVGAGVGAGAGVAGYKYAEGNIETTYNYPLNQTVNASTAALKQSGIQVNDTRSDPTKATIQGTRKSDSTPVTVTLKPESPTKTQASIRVGMLGDEQAAQVINQKITDQLKKQG